MHDIAAATRSWAEAKALLAAASEAIVAHFASNPEGGTDNRVRHLQAEEDGAKRRVALCAAKVTALERLNAVESAAQAEAAQVEIDQEAQAFRETCRGLLEERRHRAADALVEWLTVEVGSGTASAAFSGNPSGWVGQLARTTGVDAGSEALNLIRQRRTEG